MAPLLKNVPASPDAAQKVKPHKHKTNWHEAAACAVQIELRDFAHLLQFQTEYVLGKNNFRIDLLVIKKLCEHAIPKNIASIFCTLNIFEIKGKGSSVNTDTYYKTIGYAGLLIDQIGKTNQYTNTDISLSFLCLHYPKTLIAHLTKKRKLTVAKFSPGVYHISNEIFRVQIIVTSRMSPDENLYLRCLTDHLNDIALVSRLADDYAVHQEQEVYRKYLHQLSNANTGKKGANTMAVCEWLLNLYGTSQAEIEERTTQKLMDIYLPKIDALSAQNDYLKELLTKHNIPFKLEP